VRLLIYLVVKGPKDELIGWGQLVDVKTTYRQPSESLRLPLPIQPKSTMYFCAAFYVEQDLHLAEKETERRLGVLFAPGGVADIASLCLGETNR
jgi:hypothetical protein